MTGEIIAQQPHRVADASDVLSFPRSVLARTELTTGAKLVYGVALNHFWNQHPISQPDISRQLYIPLATVRRHLDELVRHRLLTKENRPGRTNLYTVTT